jgi:hypothetical protein
MRWPGNSAEKNQAYHAKYLHGSFPCYAPAVITRHPILTCPHLPGLTLTLLGEESREGGSDARGSLVTLG